MKKLTLLFLSMFFITVLAACTETTIISTTEETTTQTTLQTTELTTTQETTTVTTTLEKLLTPLNATVVDNILTFDEVTGANRYRIALYDDNQNLVGEYNITSGFNLALLLSVGTYTFQIKATGSGYQDSDYTESVGFEIVDPNRTNLLAGEDMNDQTFLRWFGRTYYNENEAAKYFYFTASGFELAFFGTELKVTFKAANYANTSKQPYLVILIDGEEDPTKGTTIILDQAEAEYTLVTGLEDGYHTVKVLKRNEAIDSEVAVKGISTDGYFTDPPQAKSFRIQYIAASSSTGFGNLGTVSEAKTSANSHGLLAYAYLSSYLLDAEPSIFAASGWGVSRGYNTGGNTSATQNIPYGFEYFAIDSSNYVFQAPGKWDITNFIPDVIVVNLGTNDFNASGYRNMDETEQAALEQEFITNYTAFLLLLNNMYPNAKIIVAYGLMNEQLLLEDFTLQIIDDANEEIGSTVIYPFEMEGAGTNGNPYGCSYHPNVKTSMNVAEALAELISSITGRQIVRDMITYE